MNSSEKLIGLIGEHQTLRFGLGIDFNYKYDLSKAIVLLIK